VHCDTVFPQCEGCYVRFDDRKIIFGKMEPEMETKIEIHDSDAGIFVPCTWSQQHYIDPDHKNSLSVNVSLFW